MSRNPFSRIRDGATERLDNTRGYLSRESLANELENIGGDIKNKASAVASSTKKHALRANQFLSDNYYSTYGYVGERLNHLKNLFSHAGKDATVVAEIEETFAQITRQINFEQEKKGWYGVTAYFDVLQKIFPEGAEQVKELRDEITQEAEQLFEDSEKNPPKKLFGYVIDIGTSPEKISVTRTVEPNKEENWYFEEQEGRIITYMSTSRKETIKINVDKPKNISLFDQAGKEFKIKNGLLEIRGDQAQSHHQTPNVYSPQIQRLSEIGKKDYVFLTKIKKQLTLTINKQAVWEDAVWLHTEYFTDEVSQKATNEITFPQSAPRKQVSIDLLPETKHIKIYLTKQKEIPTTNPIFYKITQATISSRNTNRSARIVDSNTKVIFDLSTKRQQTTFDAIIDIENQDSVRTPELTNAPEQNNPPPVDESTAQQPQQPTEERAPTSSEKSRFGTKNKGHNNNAQTDIDTLKELLAKYTKELEADIKKDQEEEEVNIHWEHRSEDKTHRKIKNIIKEKDIKEGVENMIASFTRGNNKANHYVNVLRYFFFEDDQIKGEVRITKLKRVFLKNCLEEFIKHVNGGTQ